jgi:hypothetical protein
MQAAASAAIVRLTCRIGARDAMRREREEERHPQTLDRDLHPDRIKHIVVH